VTGSIAQGINGGGLRGINGGGLRGINGGGLRGINGGGLRGINGGGLRGVGAAVIGPVDRIVSDGSLVTITILGQSFLADPATSAGVREGDYVAAVGNLVGVLSAIEPMGTPYLPGSSTVELLARADTVDESVARASFGSVVVDYSSQLAIRPDFAPTAGEFVQVSGTQPIEGGLILPTDIATRE
jgi:hypothetical protein